MKNAKPNVVLINADDLGYGDLGCYGSRVNKTPFIDRLAQNGAVFTSCYSASPLCSPSRAGLMTGCYPSRVSIDRVLFPADPLGLHPAEFTMPRLFKNAGYATMLVGKWHLGDQPEFLPRVYGFDEYYGLPYSNDMGRSVGRDDPEMFHPLPLVEGETVVEQQPDQRSLTERYVEKCVGFIRKNRDNPFFLYFAQMHVHLPHYAAEMFEHASANGDYGACVASMDWACGAVVHELETLGLLDNTIVIFTSDNGARGDRGSSNYPLRGGKRTTWEGGQRMPFVLYWKDRIAPGTRNDAFISQMDLLPTFATLLGEPLGGLSIDGLDLSDTLLSGAPSPRESYAYIRAEAKIEAVRLRNWKMHFSKEGKSVRLLYDLSKDISEENNVIDEYPDIAAEITKVCDEYRLKLGDRLTDEAGSERRPCGVCENPVPLAEYDPEHPYIIALYDKNDVG